MKKLSFTLLLFLYSVLLIAQPAGYYNPATGLSGTPLRQALHDLIDGHTSSSYSALLGHYQNTDKKPNGKVWDMYSDVPGGTPPYEFSFSNNCGNYAKEGDCYNREHSWPQSWFNEGSPMRSDLFHVVPSDGKVNGLRSNFPYGEVSNPTTTTLNGSKLGPCSFPGYSGTVFEPIDEYKGDFARTYFYMCTRYYTEDNGWQNNAMVTGANLKPWALDLMKKWHQQDPVSAKEIARNNAVYNIQGNRNPFIDHPEYVCMIWSGGTFCTISPTIANLIRIPATPTLSDSVNINANITDDGSIVNVYAKWGNTSGNLNNTLSMKVLSGTTYTLITRIPPQADGSTVYYQVYATDNSNNTSSSAVTNYSIGTPASPAPVITNSSRIPANPTSNDAVNINATITDDGSISSASLTWGTNGTTFPNTIAMTVVSGNNYKTSTAIPSQNAGITVYYKIQAVDNLTQTSTSSVEQYTVVPPSTTSCATDLIFSEYLEGSSNNKYLEIYNGTGNTVALSNYVVELYSNGSTSITQSLSLTGTLANGQVLVIKNSAGTVYTGPGVVSNVTFFNGDDAVALKKVSTGAFVDILGRIGEDPGTAWTSGNIAMNEQTLVRKPSVKSGVSVNPASGFPTLGTEWISFPTDDASNLGSHTMDCPVGNNGILTLPVSGVTFCKGSVLNVPFQVTGSINQGNIFTAQLSDKNGSFTNSLNIGTLSSNAQSGVIVSVIPSNIENGTQYRVRVTSSAPQITGDNNGTNLSIVSAKQVNAGNDIKICSGESINLQASGSDTYIWDMDLGDTDIVTVAPTVTTSYRVVGIDNNGCTSSDTVTVTVVSIETPVITREVEELRSSATIGNQWYLNSQPIQGETGQTLNLATQGTGDFFTIVTIDGCMSDTSNVIMRGMGIGNQFIKLNVYPNPGSGIFTLDMTGVSLSNYTYTIYNYIGKRVMSGKFDNQSDKMIFDLNEEANGMYIIELNGNGKSYRSVLIKQ